MKSLLLISEPQLDLVPCRNPDDFESSRNQVKTERVKFMTSDCLRFWFRARFAPVGRAGGMTLLLFACSPVWRPRCCWFLRPVRIVCSILFFWQTAPQRYSIRKLLQRNSWRIPMLQEVWKPFPQHSGIGLLFFPLLLHLPHVRSFISFFGAVRGAHLRSKQNNAKRRGLMSAPFLFE